MQAPDIDRYGIARSYEDAHGRRKASSRNAREAIQAAMRLDDRALAEAQRRVLVLREAPRSSFDEAGELRCEDGTTRAVAPRAPVDLPLGYHDFFPAAGGPVVRVIVAPDKCPLPPQAQSWGWAVQLFAARSTQSWGIGDLGDLAALARWSKRLGGGVILINPLAAVDPALPQQASPYYPTSRRFRNPLYLCMEDIPGASDAGLDLARLAAEGRALNTARHIDRDAVFRLKREAFELLWSRFGGDTRFEQYCERQGPPLAEFATYCALVEAFGGDWHRWGPEFRRPDAPGVSHFFVQNTSRVRFHQWLQWLVDEQLASASRELAVMQDLPIGFDPGGADAWAWQDVLAAGVSVGAPSDIYNTQGQNWGLPPFVPQKLRAAAYEPFIQTIRAALRHAGGLRIDHVMGLFRLFWIPQGMSPQEGAYVYYPADDLLAILALESHRAGAFVVGEDLGTVADDIRRRLAARQILSYRLVWFEEDRPARYPQLALAAVTTHDLPTIAGLWSGSDLAIQESLKLKPDAQAVHAIRARLRKMTGLADDAPATRAVDETYRLLAEAPSRVLTATLDDVLAVEERPNMPSTTTQWPNWSIALPRPIEEIMAHPRAESIAKALARGQVSERDFDELPSARLS